MYQNEKIFRLMLKFGCKAMEEQMKTKISWTAALVIVVLFLSGCATTPQGIYTSRMSSINAGSHDVRVDQFGSGETPAVVVTGCGGKTVTVRIYNVFSG